jgi:ABC-type nitrate/sulfonate/bicarbonate transport system substrate-binding protein
MSKSIESLWYTRCTVPTALGLASQLGLLERKFSPDGIEIRSIQDSRDPDVRASHFDHRLQYSVRQGGSIPAIWARARGVETRVVGLTWTEETQSILVSPGSKIRELTDLKGKRLAIPKHVGQSIEITGTGALRAFSSALETVGLSESDVEFVELPVQKEVWEARGSVEGARQGRNEFWPDAHALIRGEADAIFVKGSRGKEVESFLGARVIYDLSTHPDWRVRVNNGVPRPLTVDTRLLDDHPDVVRRIVDLVTTTGEWARKHAAEVVSHVSREVFSIEPWVRAAYPDLHLHLGTTLDDWLIDGLQHYTTFLARRGIIAKDFDVRTWIAAESLAEVLAKGTRELTQKGNHLGAVSGAQ